MAIRDILAHFGVTVDQTQLIAAQQNVNKLIGQFNGLARVATFALSVLGTGKIVDSFDGYIEIENRLKAATTSTEDFVAAQKAVFDIARSTATPVADVTEQFQRYNLATENLGKSQAEVLDFTKRVNQATKLGGATAQETRGALIQLAQGLGTDFKAAGQEIRSIQKSAPLLAKIIANAAGGSAGELTALAKSGKLTSKLVFEAVRDAGELIDKEFAQRKLRYEDISTLFGVEWLALVKQLEPMFSKLIVQLTGLVTWTREWVEDGSAMNSVFAGVTTAVYALTAAFSGLAIRAAIAAAPLVALFLILEDIYTFMNGGESVLGDVLDAFDKGGADKFRAIVQTWGDILTGVLTGSFDKAIDHGAKRLREAFGMAEPVGPQAPDVGYKPDGTQGPIDEQGGILQPAFNWLMGGEEFRAQVREARIKSGWTTEMLGNYGNQEVPNMTPASTSFMNWGRSTMPAPMNPSPTSSVNPYGQGPLAPPPVINNTITVQGNADGETAREIATETGKATTAALGRGRDAIGAGLGMFP